MCNNSWKVIVSRLSCAGKSIKVWPSIEQRLKDKGIGYNASITNHKYHAIEIAAEAVSEGFRKFLVIGGDGALHEVLNGACSSELVNTSELTFAIIPIGSGNDWARGHNIPFDPEKAIDIIADEKNIRKQDICCVTTLMDGKPYTRYMINIGGLGFDAFVCYKFDMAKARGKAGDKQYLKVMLKSLLFYRSLPFQVKVDGEDFFSGKAMSLALGIGRFSGGGMLQTPEAVMDDGLTELTVIPKMGILKLLKCLPPFLAGKIYSVKEVCHTRGKKIEISANPFSFMEIDGELVGRTPVTIETLPKAIKVVSNL